MKKHTILLSIVALALIGWGVSASQRRLQPRSNTMPPPPVADNAPRSAVSNAQLKPVDAAPKIEVCFVLDTTGSMGGLIEGAKQKIWSIANEMVKAKPTPEIKIALVAYRDKGDEYVTKTFPLTNDLDTVYAQLQKFTASGGGDTPESVNEALADAVGKISWSQDRSTLKIIFLVGDAPPHMDYANGPKYPDVCLEAVKKDIIINTIQCGNETDTTPVWTRIAKLAEGHFAAISQTGNVAVIAAPQDEELAKLNREIGKTLVAYGTIAEQKEVWSKQAASESSFASATSAPAAADRLKYNSVTRKTVQGGNDLVEDYQKDNSIASKIGKDKLPEPLQKMNPAELEAYLKTQQSRRMELQARIDQVGKERSEFLDAERKKLADSGKNKDSFDDEVARILRVEAAKKGLTY